MKMRLTFFLAACAALLTAGGVAQAAGNAEAGKVKAAACGACHGADGNSMAPDFPKLAGQVPDYIVKQLQEFKAGVRANEFMQPMAQPLSEQDMEDIAAYFAAQKVKPTEGKAEALAEGEKIYRKGKPGPGVGTVAACMGCHGQGGEGNANWGERLAAPPSVLAPSVGGQYAAYIEKQLKAFADGTRSNDVGKVMHNIVVRLTDEEIKAVSQYAATLTR